MTARDRAQLVIALGEGTKGNRLRALLDKAAKRTNKSVSTWAREVLTLAARGARCGSGYAEWSIKTKEEDS